jgi:hypothetical protein
MLTDEETCALWDAFLGPAASQIEEFTRTMRYWEG